MSPSQRSSPHHCNGLPAFLLVMVALCLACFPGNLSRGPFCWARTITWSACWANGQMEVFRKGCEAPPIMQDVSRHEVEDLYQITSVGQNTSLLYLSLAGGGGGPFETWLGGKSPGTFHSTHGPRLWCKHAWRWDQQCTSRVEIFERGNEALDGATERGTDESNPEEVELDEELSQLECQSHEELSKPLGRKSASWCSIPPRSGRHCPDSTFHAPSGLDSSLAVRSPPLAAPPLLVP